MTDTMPEAPTPDARDNQTKTASIIYILYLLSLLLPVIGLVGLIMAYVNKSGASDMLQSHYRFQIRTFWIGLLYSLIGVLLMQILVGGLILLFTLVWVIIRCAKGLKLLGEQNPIPNPGSWMFG